MQKVIQKHRYFRMAGIVSATFLFVMMTLLAFPIVLKTDLVDAAPYVASDTTLNIVTGKETATVDLTISDSNGTFAASSADDSAEFSVITDNYTGYSLYIIGSDDDGELVNSNASASLDSISEITSSSDFSASENNEYNSKWGFKPNKYVVTEEDGSTTVIDNTVAENFLPSPTTTSTILDKTTTANSEANDYTIAIGARADYTSASGTYSNTFTLTAVGNPVAYSITYADNTGDATVTDLPEAQSSSTTASSVTLNSTIPTRDNYLFKNWCDGTVDSEGIICTGTTYNPGDTIDLDQTTSNIITLYAVWELHITGPFIQDITQSTCPTTSTNVYDIRDNNLYTIRKMNDKNCWMTQNLRFTGTELNSETSNVASSYTVSNPLTISYGELATGDTSANSYTEAKIHNSGNTKDGVWYNYAAATAMTITGSDNTTDAEYSLCPAGWRLPNYDEIVSVASSGSIFNIVRGGEYFDGQAQAANSYGDWWSSTSRNSTNRRLLYAYGNTALDNFSYSRQYGLYVRCVLETSNYDRLLAGDLTMQDIGNLPSSERNELLSQMTTGTAYSATDSRDSEVYQIAKLADGKIWLLDNLRLGSSDTVNLTPSDTNINSNYTLPTSSSTISSYTNAEINADSKNETTTAYGESSGKIGVYYNYCAASAGTYCNANGADPNSSQIYDITHDICPVGWSMPTGGSTGEYQSLFASYSSNISNFQNALSTPLSGYFSSAPQDLTTSGSFWSSTYNNSTNMFNLNLSSSSISTAATNARNQGLNVRCVLSTHTLAEISNMQSINTAIRSNTPSGTTATIKDVRDNQSYTVTKIGDDLWMTRNLAIGCNGSATSFGGTAVSRTLTSDTSNVSTSWNTPTAGLSNGDNYTTPYQTCSSTYGAWYNYSATTAGTITGDENSDVPTDDICPAGWNLPTEDQQTALIPNISQFNPTYGGIWFSTFYYYETTSARWWAKSYYYTTMRPTLKYENGSLSIDHDFRYDGVFVRCVAK